MPDSGFAKSLTGSTLQTSPLQPAMRSSIVSGSLFILFVLTTSLCTASAQTAPTDRSPEPLEKRGMPPAPLGTYRLESSPRMISQFGPFVSYQVNVDAQGN